ncbi:MAG TPA: hypothetical protein VMY40_11815 [Anaerolineae bacterium]|nr:hypothetical protein [Anaerolineae bacterium]
MRFERLIEIVGDYPTEDTWRQLVRTRLQGPAWDQVSADVRPFVEPTAEVGLLTLENVLRALG